MVNKNNTKIIICLTLIFFFATQIIRLDKLNKNTIKSLNENISDMEEKIDILEKEISNTNNKIDEVENILTDKIDKCIIEVNEKIKIMDLSKIEDEVVYQTTQNYIQNNTNESLTSHKGIYYNANGNKETYYNLNMSGVINKAKNNGIEGEYWIREDGVKMYGEYVIVAANYNTYPYGTTVETSLGTGIVLDTGAFANEDPTQLDLATDWR